MLQVPSPILDDRESLLKLYSEYSQTSRFIVDKIWTNARFFTTLTSALITVSIGALVKVVLDEPVNPQASTACLLLALLPVIVNSASIQKLMKKNRLKHSKKNILT